MNKKVVGIFSVLAVMIIVAIIYKRPQPQQPRSRSRPGSATMSSNGWPDAIDTTPYDLDHNGLLTIDEQEKMFADLNKKK